MFPRSVLGTSRENAREVFAAPQPASARSAATLTEVLMCLFIMSLGIFPLMTMFPLSLYSSIRATQLTNAKLLEENVVESLRTQPELLLGATEWQPNTTYAAGQWVIPSQQGGSLIPNHNRVFQCGGAGTSGFLEPVWNAASVNDNGITWSRLTPFQYAIDEIARTDNLALATQFGNDRTNTYGPQRLNLSSCLNRTAASLRQKFQLPDSWSIETEAVPTAVTASRITFSPEIDLSNLDGTYRITVFDASGVSAVVRGVSSVNAASRQLDLAAPLPTAMSNLAGVSKVRIESQASRYSWMLTVNRDATGRTVAQCAVFFNRSINSDDEFAYEYVPGATNDSVTVNWTPGTDPDPLMQTGRYAFDLDSGRWHRIVEAPSAPGGTLILETSLPFTTAGTKRMIFPPGVVHVFDIEL